MVDPSLFMNHVIFQEGFSEPRIHRFRCAKNIRNEQEAQILYQTNLRLSIHLFAIMSIFEVVLRNAIDRHYLGKFGKDWLKEQAGSEGFFEKKGCEKSRINLLGAVEKLGEKASNDQIVAFMTFGFWRNLFNSKEFAAGGNTLDQIFLNHPKGLSHNDVFAKLTYLNFARNRIAHHEPICFEHSRSPIPSPNYIKGIYTTILEMCFWLGYTRIIFLENANFLEDEIKKFELLLKS